MNRILYRCFLEDDMRKGVIIENRGYLDGEICYPDFEILAIFALLAGYTAPFNFLFLQIYLFMYFRKNSRKKDMCLFPTLFTSLSAL